MAVEVHHAEHVPQWKQDEIDNIKKLIQSHKVFGMVGIEGIIAIRSRKFAGILKTLR